MSKLTKSGLTAEDFVIKNFRYAGTSLKKSTFKDDYYKDIDATHEVLGKVSIKSQSSKYKNFAVEIRQHDGDNDLIFIDGWFYSGEANTYLLVIRDENTDAVLKLHIIDKKKLIDFITLTKPSEIKSYHAQKLNRGRKYDLPVVYLLPLEDLVRHGVIEKTFLTKN